MKKTANADELAELHKKLAQAFLDALDEKVDEEGNPLKVNPGLLTAAAKFLKDNDITCPADESETQTALAERLANKKRHSVGNVTHLDDE